MNLQVRISHVSTYQAENKHSTRKHMLIWVSNAQQDTHELVRACCPIRIGSLSSAFRNKMSQPCKRALKPVFRAFEDTPSVFPRYITAPRSSKHSIFAEDLSFPRGISYGTKTYSPRQETGRISRPFHSRTRRTNQKSINTQKAESEDLANNFGESKWTNILEVYCKLF